MLFVSQNQNCALLYFVHKLHFGSFFFVWENTCYSIPVALPLAAFFDSIPHDKLLYKCEHAFSFCRVLEVEYVVSPSQACNGEACWHQCHPWLLVDDQSSFYKLPILIDYASQVRKCFSLGSFCLDGISLIKWIWIWVLGSALSIINDMYFCNKLIIFIPSQFQQGSLFLLHFPFPCLLIFEVPSWHTSPLFL